MKEGEKRKGAVPSFDDGSVLTIKYLHELEDSVKTRTPVAGRGISITQTDEGSTISLVNGATAQYLKYNALSFNVCSNGVPFEISFVTKTDDNPYSGIFMVPSVVTIPTGVYDDSQPLSYIQIDTTRT